MSTIIEHHAQKSQIIEDIIGGLSQKQVGTKYNLSKDVVHRFYATRIKPALAAIDYTTLGHSCAISEINTNGSDDKTVQQIMNDARSQGIATQRTGLAMQFAAKIASYDHRVDKMLAVTEGGDENKADPRAFAAVHGQILKSIELQGRFSGALSLDSTTINANIAVMSFTDDSRGDRQDDASQVIDIGTMDMDQGEDGSL